MEKKQEEREKRLLLVNVKKCLTEVAPQNPDAWSPVFGLESHETSRETNLEKWQVPRVFLNAFVFEGNKDTTHWILEFFAAHVRNKNTRDAYVWACERFFLWCEAKQISISKLQATHVAFYVEEMGNVYAIPTIKQHMASIRMVLDFLTVKGVLKFNPALSVRTPRYSISKGKTPVMQGEDVRILFDSIPNDSVAGLRDSALIGAMVYTFARIGAVLQMKVGDFYANGRRHFLRFHEKRGKEHEVPAHVALVESLFEYLEASGIQENKKAPLFQSIVGGKLTGKVLLRENVLHMVKRRCKKAGIGEIFGCHTFRATGITAYLKAGGTLEKAQQIAAHACVQTTKLYDRTCDEVDLEEIQRMRF